jgi:hypothetical protein
MLTSSVIRPLNAISYAKKLFLSRSIAAISGWCFHLSPAAMAMLAHKYRVI